ncbi:hypothetical protein [Bradyrhizobium sp. ORS 111]|uniref:hypothetical protein n=1 Tax=Bradyrhizobium sp. ORS 111 TaxID=1685958 RepID=UPI00388E63A4
MPIAPMGAELPVVSSCRTLGKEAERVPRCRDELAGVQARRRLSPTSAVLGSAPKGCLNEFLHGAWHFIVLRDAAPELVGNILGDIARPSFGGVEGHNADRVAVLVVHQTPDQGFAIGALFIRFAPGAAKSAEIVQHQVGIMVRL